MQMALEQGRDHAVAALQAAAPPPGLEGHVPDEGEQQPTDGGHGSYAGEFVDNMSGKWLDSDLVRAGRKSDIDIIHQMGAWRVIQRPEGAHVIGTRWVDVDKGIETGPSTGVDWWPRSSAEGPRAMGSSTSRPCRPWRRYA